MRLTQGCILMSITCKFRPESKCRMRAPSARRQLTEVTARHPHVVPVQSLCVTLSLPLFCPSPCFFVGVVMSSSFPCLGLRYIGIHNLTLTPSSVTPTPKRRSNVLYVSTVTVCRLVRYEKHVSQAPPLAYVVAFWALVIGV